MKGFYLTTILKGWLSIQKKIMLAHTYINYEVKLLFLIKKVLCVIDNIFTTKVLWLQSVKDEIWQQSEKIKKCDKFWTILYKNFNKTSFEKHGSTHFHLASFDDYREWQAW